MRETQENLSAIIAESALRWDIPEGVSARLLSHSENAVFLLSHGDWKRVLRIHRMNYHSASAIRSELDWMAALTRDKGIETPIALPGTDGQLIQYIAPAAGEKERFVVLFDFISGREPQVEDMEAAFGHLGAMAATMHNHAREWERPAYFERMVWDYENSLGSNPNWGGWEPGFAGSQSDIEVVRQADRLMKEQLAAYGTGPDRFGLIHSDLRSANLLIEDGKTKILDFDDCGIGWFLYDLASALSFQENHERADAIIAAWVAGYRTVAPLPDEELSIVPTLMLLRRLIVMGWAGSHPETELAHHMRESGYTAGTVTLAQRYLQNNS
ncbi:phosphotransferase enzyme family protein [Paracoccus versutus]|uniref:Ser/Thr protein kinase RdoA (MazF antagonist) n=1 Tax=Paracoccus versutus TaxID=34007 RepID=A0A3D9XUK1_PARVE|nr:phosphotransferase [Paracoccus versutus]REF73391.1 Ser/Thr protein kinase RdoA (MazF antagonist) [Paracoccus versutus]